MDGLSVKVTMEDGAEHQHVLRPRVIVDFEQKFGGGMAKLLGNDQKLEHIYFLGWATLKANGIPVKPWGSSFLDDIKQVELVTDPSLESTETA
jgi:hypothetical protein